MKKIRIFAVVALIILWAMVLLPRAHQTRRRSVCPQIISTPTPQAISPDKDKLINEAFALLKIRHDAGALEIYRRILAQDPNDEDALWGQAEIYRRRRQFNEAELIFKRILRANPCYAPALISLSYLHYNDDRLDEALDLINKALAVPGLDNENKGLAYMMLGTVNSRRSQKGMLIGKIKFGLQIKNNFLTAQSLAPDLPEVHLGLGTFYLKAPAVAGGDLNKAIVELQKALKIAPDFATANVRLAQAYRKKGDLPSYDLYMKKAREIDPGCEALGEK